LGAAVGFGGSAVAVVLVSSPDPLNLTTSSPTSTTPRMAAMATNGPLLLLGTLPCSEGGMSLMVQELQG
jgi:hypothetical protein